MLRPGFDRIVRTALLGVQFRDAFDRRVVADGLRVDLLDAFRPGQPLPLHAGPSGVFGVHALPGMSGFDDADGTSPPFTVAGRFRLLVRDTLRRYVDTSVAVTVPAEGLFQPECPADRPADALPHVPLYSAPTRPVPAALAVVRADLRLATDEDRPASWARIDLWVGAAKLATGIADATGGVLILAALPAPQEPPRRLSPAAGFDRMAWDVSLRAYWTAAARGPGVPDVCDLLAQPEVAVLAARSAPPRLGALQLRAGEPLIAASEGSSFLLVSE